MQKGKNILFSMILVCMCAAVLGLGGCRAAPDRVFYYGNSYSASREALIVKTTPQALQEAGYVQIGTITSEPQTQSARFESPQQDEQALIDQLAPEKSKDLTLYYTMIDEQACRRAAKAGGDVIRLEEIRHTFPEFTPETAVLLGKDVGRDIKAVTSVKVWSVWRQIEQVK